MDCSIVPSKKYADMVLISTTDFFYPLVEDPYLQGRVAACNVLSDMYALGVVDIDNVLMLLAASRDMPKQQRVIVTKLMMKGFNDMCEEAGTKVTGGQTVLNPWPIIGGVAKSICKEADFIRPELGSPGDVMVLTKPIGTQLAVNAREWTRDEHKWDQVKDLGVTKEDVARAFKISVGSMSHLNRTGARLMHKYGGRGCTDVTGFGILGHAENLAKAQRNTVELRLHTLPIIRHMKTLADRYTNFKLMEGYSAETSGGLLIIMPKENAQDFCDEISSIDKWPAWIIGDVLATDADKSSATIAKGVKVIEV